MHSHRPHKETEDEDLENTLIENYEDEVEPLDKYEDNNEDPDLEEIDEQLADPRAYPRPFISTEHFTTKGEEVMKNLVRQNKSVWW